MNAFDVVWPEEYSRDYTRDYERISRPTDGQVFDLIEFSYEYIAQPIILNQHEYWNHYHYKYDEAVGRSAFEAEINRIFERNGIAYELKGGEVIRIAPTGLHEALAETIFKTGDQTLDGLLEDARHKFLNRDLKVRKESLERLMGRLGAFEDDWTWKGQGSPGARLANQCSQGTCLACAD